MKAFLTLVLGLLLCSCTNERKAQFNDQKALLLKELRVASHLTFLTEPEEFIKVDDAIEDLLMRMDLRDDRLRIMIRRAGELVNGSSAPARTYKADLAKGEDRSRSEERFRTVVRDEVDKLRKEALELASEVAALEYRAE